MWLEDNRLVVMSVVGGQAKELLQLAGGVMGHMAFDLRANSLLWNSKIAGCLAFLIGTRHSNEHNYLYIYICFCSHNVLSVYFGLFAGLITLSLQKEQSHHAGRKLAISGSVIAALEPFILSHSGDKITLWDRQDESILQTTTEELQVLDVLPVLKDIRAGRVAIVTHHYV